MERGDTSSINIPSSIFSVQGPKNRLLFDPPLDYRLLFNLVSTAAAIALLLDQALEQVGRAGLEGRGVTGCALRPRCGGAGARRLDRCCHGVRPAAAGRMTL